MSNGIEIRYLVKITKRLRKLYQALSKKQKHSKNFNKIKTLIQKEYLKANNRKKDIKNKILHILKDEFELIIFQNDSIKGWQKIWGERILNTAIGGIIADLRRSATSIEVDRFFPSTKKCSHCHHIQYIGLDERVFRCENCNYTVARDLNSALNIEQEGLKRVGVEHIEFKPVENKPLPRLLERFNSIPGVKASLLSEAGSPMTTVVG